MRSGDMSCQPKGIRCLLVVRCLHGPCLGQHQCRQLCGHGRSWGYGMRSAAARPGPRRASRSPAAPSAGAPGTRRRAGRAPQVALLVAEVRVVVGQVVEGGEVQVAHLHHPRQPVQRLHRRLALACARAPAGSAAGLGATPAGLGAALAGPPSASTGAWPWPARARAGRVCGRASGLGAALTSPISASTGAWPWPARVPANGFQPCISEARSAGRSGARARRPAPRRRGRPRPACAPAPGGLAGPRTGAECRGLTALQRHGREKQPRADVQSVSFQCVARKQTRGLYKEGFLHRQACSRPERGPHQRRWPNMPLPRRARMSILAAALAPRTGLDTPETAATVNSTLPPDSVRAWTCAFVLADAHGTSHRLWQAAQQHHIGH